MSVAEIETPPPAGNLMVLPLTHIRQNPEALSIRAVKKDSAKFQELVASIRAKGVKQPIEVRPLRGPGEAGFYGLVDGLHRYTAATIAGYKEIPCIIRNVHEDEVLEEQFTANIQRIEMSASERSKALMKFLISHPNCSIDELAKRLSKSRAWVDSQLRISDLPGADDAVNGKIPGGIDVIALVNSGKISPNNASQLARLVMDPFMPDESWAELVRHAIEDTSQNFTGYVQLLLNNMKKQKLADAINSANTPIPVVRSKTEIIATLDRLRKDADRRKLEAAEKLAPDASDEEKIAAAAAAVPVELTATIRILEWVLQVDAATWAERQAKEAERKRKQEEAKQLRAAGSVEKSLALAEAVDPAQAKAEAEAFIARMKAARAAQ